MAWQEDVRAMAARAGELASDASLSDEARVAALMREFGIGEMEAWQHVEMASPCGWPSDVIELDASRD